MWHISAQNCSRVFSPKMHAGISRLLCGLLMWWCGFGQARMWCHGASSSCPLTSLIWAGDARLEIAQFLIRCKRRSVSLLCRMFPPALFRWFFLLLLPCRFIFGERVSLGPAPPRLRFSRTLRTSKFHHHSLNPSRERGVRSQGQRAAFGANVGLPVLMGLDWFCVISSEWTLLLFWDYLIIFVPWK